MSSVEILQKIPNFLRANNQILNSSVQSKIEIFSKFSDLSHQNLTKDTILVEAYFKTPAKRTYVRYEVSLKRRKLDEQGDIENTNYSRQKTKEIRRCN